MTPLEELIEATRAVLEPDDYYNPDDGCTYRTCCHARIHFYPHDCTNPHAPDCTHVRLSRALESFTATGAQHHE